MNDLNKIEDSLRRRAEAELKEVVNRFTSELNSVSAKYRIPVTGNFVVKSSASNFKTYVTVTGLNFMLHETLKEHFLDRMVEVKTEELLKKLDLYE